MESHPEIPSPAENEWKIVNEQLKIDWNDLPPALDAVLDSLVAHAIKNVQITDVHVLIMDFYVRTYAIVMQVSI